MKQKNRQEIEASRREQESKKAEALLEKWIPKSEIGRQVRDGQIKDISTILDTGKKILEPEIVDLLLPNLEFDLINIGQSKGKFGGGKRSIWKTTQKKTKEGNKPKFATIAVVGNRNGYVGIGYGKAKETVPAREKAVRQAKLNLIKVRRGSGSWETGVAEPNSIPVKTIGKCSSVEIHLMPAPKGTGLIVQKEVAKILSLAGIKDIYSKSFGKTNTAINLVKAVDLALRNLSEIRFQDSSIRSTGLVEGQIQQ